MHNRIQAFALAVALSLMVATPVTAFSANSSFDDVPTNHWAHDAIEAANADRVMTGTAPKQFSPDNNLTFAEFAAIITRAFYADEVAASTATGEWYAKYVDVFIKHQLLGEETDYFYPDIEVYRMDMAAVIHCVLLDKGLSDPLDSELQEMKNQIIEPEFDSLSNMHKKAILVCYNRKLLMGIDDKGTFNVYGLVTRSQTATIYLRLRDYMKDHGVAISSTTNGASEPIPSTPVETSTTPTGDTSFMFLPGETTTEQMMARINAATPAYREGYLTNGKPITDANIQEMLGQIKETMPNGTEWNRDSKYFYSNKMGNGGGCNSFAYAVSDAIFGEDAPLVQHKNFEKLKVGDVIWIVNNNTGYSHVMIAISSPSIYGTFLECSGNVGGQVFWPPEGASSTEDLPKPGSAVAAESIIFTRYDASTLPETANVITEHSAMGELWDKFEDLAVPETTLVSIAKEGDTLYETERPISPRHSLVPELSSI